MKDYIEERVIAIAEYIVKENATVRGASEVFCVSKSTVHKDVSERLLDIDFALYKKVRRILDKNLAERHLRGGEATRQKYSHI